MPKPVRIALAAALACSLATVVWQALRPRAPVYQGSPVRDWITRWGDVYAPWNPEHPDYDHKPMGWLPAADANVLPFLVKATSRGDGMFGKVYPRLWLGAPPAVRAHLPRPIRA